MSILGDARASENSILLEQPLAQPPAVSKRLLSGGLLGVVWLGIVIGTYLMMVGFVTLGRKTPSATIKATFTLWGQLYYRPERDIPIYILGCVGTFLLCCVLNQLWNRRLAALPPADARNFVAAHAAYNLSLAAMATVVNPVWLVIGHHILARALHIFVVEFLFLAAIVVVESVLFVRGLRSDAPLRLPRAFRLVESILLRDDYSSENRDEPAASAPAFHRGDLFALLLLCLAIYIPRPDILAGNIFQSEHFHHWDYFVMAPAVGYLHGQALCTQVYSQYGIGWPLLFASLNPIYHLSYGHLIQFANLYGCVYYCGVYLFFRVLLKDWRWALGGAFAAAYYKIFCWPGPWLVSWQLPSNTIIRGPFDIWFLLTLLLHQRTRRPSWMFAAGALTGLSLLFETDTGIYITFTFLIYNLFFLRGGWKQTGSDSLSRRAMQSGVCWLLGALVLLSGMSLGSRGTLLQGAFWRGWIECFTAYPSGISMTPVAEMLENITYGMIMIGVYLFALNYRFLRFLQFGNGKQNAPAASDLALTCVALYGTCTMLHFIGRSNPANLLVGSLGFALILVIGLHRLIHFLASAGRSDNLIATLPRWTAPTALFLVVLHCLLNTGTRHYPNLVHQIFRGAHPENFILEYTYTDPPLVTTKGLLQLGALNHELSFSPGVALYPGSDILLPEEKVDAVRQFNLVADDMRRLTAAGKRIAVIANDDTAYYVAANAPLWNKYSPLLPNLVTKAQVAQVQRQLADKTADYVFVTAHDASTTFVSWHPLTTTDAWEALRATIRAHYVLDHTSGIFEVYRR